MHAAAKIYIKPNMTTLLLVRHGETVDNVNQILQGQTPGRLTACGEAQAEEVAVKMENEKIDVFVSRDLKRSVDTCRIIARRHHAEVLTTPLLRERDWGSFTGRFIPDLKNAVWPDDIETLEAMKQRAAAFLQYVRDNFGGMVVMAVGHGIINKAVQSVYTGKPMNEIMKMGNAEVRKLVL